MATLVCRVCLVDNMTLCSVKYDLQNVYKTIAREKYNKVGYPVHMCYICLTVLRKCQRFMETARATNNVLKQWHKQQHEMRVARPLFTYSTSKVGVVSTYNGNISLQHEIKVEEVDLGVDEVYLDDFESNIDVNLEKTDLGDQADSSELLLYSPNDNTYIDDVENNNDRQIDQLSNGKMNLKATSSTGSTLDGHTNVETIIKCEIISPHDNDAPHVKKCKTNETKPQQKAPKTSGETAAGSGTSYNSTPLNSTPSQPRNIRHRHLTFDKNCSKKETPKLNRIVKKNTVQKKNKRLVKNILKNRNNSNKLPLNTSTTEKHKLNTRSYNTKVTQHLSRCIKGHTDDKLFSCDICNYKSIRKGDLKKHMITHTSENPFLCDICDCKFKLEQSLLRHLNTHAGEKTFKCDICRCKFTEKRNLAKHVITHSTTGNSNLVTHLGKHTGEKPVSCKISNCKSKRMDSSVRYLKTEAVEKPFKCNICDCKCAAKGDLAKHIRTHTGIKPYFCEICAYKCTDNANFKRHMRTHTGEKPFSCDICNYKFNEKSNLVVHLRTHTGEKPFSCYICNYKFARKDYLVKHLKTHIVRKSVGVRRRGNARPQAKPRHSE